MRTLTRKRAPYRRRDGTPKHTILGAHEALEVGWCLSCDRPVSVTWTTGANGAQYPACRPALTESVKRRVSAYGDHERPYLAHRKNACEYPGCGFTPDLGCDGRPVMAQLTVHHMDGDKANGDPSNLRTLCDRHHKLIHADADHLAAVGRASIAERAWREARPDLNGGAPPEAQTVPFYPSKREYDVAYARARRAAARSIA